MNKLQLRVDRADAECIRDALKYLSEYWDNRQEPGQALRLATWVDHRIAQYFGPLGTPETGRRRKTNGDLHLQRTGITLESRQ